MKKKFQITLFVVFMMLFVGCMINASAETSGIYTYSISGGKATITDCDETASGDIVIPAKLGKYPVISIGYSAFSYCDSLTSITIPNSVTSIGNNAFYSCDSLESITIPNSVTSIGYYAFSYCENLTSITIPNSVTSIGYSAFSYCKSLESITIPNSVTSIGDYAFSYCENLTSIEIPNSVTSIGNYAFSYCINLSKVYISNLSSWCKINFSTYSSNPLYYARDLYLNGNLVVEMTIPDGVTSIGNYAFCNCDSILSVKIPNSVTSIGNSAFYECSSLTSITIPNSVTSIEDYVFYKCSSLTSITIPNSVTSIGNDAFYGCRSLTSVEIPNSVTSIGYEVFYSCDSLKSITIPNSVTSIGDYAFYECKNLTSITIPDSVTSIGISMFYGCKSLKCVGMSVGIYYIKKDAFNGCSNLELIFYEGNESQWNEIAVYSGNEKFTNAEVVYNARKKTYKFETNCESKLDDINDYAIYDLPTVQNDGKILAGWYDNAALSGKPVTFPYFEDATTLYAAWVDGGGESFDNAITATLNKSYIMKPTEYVYFKFVPKLSKIYIFETRDAYGAEIYIYDSKKKKLSSDWENYGNSYIEYNMSAGQTYYVAVKSHTNRFITFLVNESIDYRIDGVSFRETNGSSSQTIPEGLYYVTVSYTNVSSNEKPVIFIVQYRENGEIDDLKCVKANAVTIGSTNEISAMMNNSAKRAKKLKVFMWKTSDTVIPMSNSMVFTVE